MAVPNAASRSAAILAECSFKIGLEHFVKEVLAFKFFEESLNDLKDALVKLLYLDVVLQVVINLLA